MTPNNYVPCGCQGAPKGVGVKQRRRKVEVTELRKGNCKKGSQKYLHKYTVPPPIERVQRTRDHSIEAVRTHKSDKMLETHANNCTREPRALEIDLVLSQEGKYIHRRTM